MREGDDTEAEAVRASTPTAYSSTKPAIPATLARSLRGFVKGLLVAAASGAFGWYGVTWLLHSGVQLAPQGTDRLLKLYCIIGATIVALPVQVIIHELGHALLGRAFGGFLLRLVIGPWRYQRYRSGFRWQRVRLLKGLGGFVQILMPPDQRFRVALTWMLLGGPTANLVIAGLGLLLMWFAPWWPLRVFAIPVVMVGLMIGLINLAPFRVSGFLTDGAQIWRIWTDRSALDRMQRMTRLLRASIDGLRPRDLDPDDIAALDPGKLVGLERFVALAVRVSVAEDEGRLEDARKLAHGALEDWDRLPDGFRQLLALSAAGTCARLDRDASGARKWLARAEGGLLEDFQVAWVEALIAELEGHTDEMALALDRVRKGIEDTIYVGDEQVYRERLAAMA